MRFRSANLIAISHERMGGGMLLLLLLCSTAAFASEMAVSALSVDAALAANVPLVFSGDTARSLLEARGAAASSSSGLRDHIPALRQLAQLGSVVVEWGAHDQAMTWALLRGVSDAPSGPRRFFSSAGMDALPPELSEPLGRALGVNISLNFGMDALAGGADVLVLDGMHSFGALSQVLRAAAPHVRGFIAIPRTETFGLVSETVRSGGDVAAAAASASFPALHAAVGTKAALFDFLASPAGMTEWTVSAHFPNGCGLTVLRRVAGLH